MTMSISLQNINLMEVLPNKNRLISAATTRIDLAPHVTFVEKVPPMPEYSTEKSCGKVGNEGHLTRHLSAGICTVLEQY